MSKGFVAKLKGPVFKSPELLKIYLLWQFMFIVAPVRDGT